MGPEPRPRAGGARRAARRSGLVLLLVAACSVGASTRPAAPPRFDGAGYAMLATALASGQGYRSTGHPDAPPHAHFPPGYPLALAALWRGTGVSTEAAHWFSAACTVGAVLALARWLRGLYPARVAVPLGLALAVNWSWGRIGGAIQSEPLYLLLSGLALLLASAARRRGGPTAGALLGLVLGAAVLTRHVGACLVLAVAIDLALRRRWLAVLTALASAAAVVAPWVAWQARVGQGTQAQLFPAGGLGPLVAGQALFYLRRIPDLVLGPFVEVATVFGRSAAVAGAATAFAAAATALVLAGWLVLVRDPRRRLAGLVPLATLPVLLGWPFTEAGRFLVPLLPFVLAGLVDGLAWAGRRLFGRTRTRRPLAWLVVLASLPYAAYAIATDRAGAQERTHAAFDAACRWLAAEADRPGPVLARHPADVSWLTGRPSLAPESDDPAAVAALVRRHGVAYLLLDADRYANAPPGPLAAYLAAAAATGEARLAWSDPRGASVYTLDPAD